MARYMLLPLQLKMPSFSEQNEQSHMAQTTKLKSQQSAMKLNSGQQAKSVQHNEFLVILTNCSTQTKTRQGKQINPYTRHTTL
jgi:uncharacterized membrane protein